MALPMNATPTYSLVIPSTKQNVRYRPFLVKEEKALLIAQQSESEKVMVDTLKEIVSSCIKDDVNVDKLATFDLEYILSQIRAKSVGEIVELIMKCDTCQDEKAKVKLSFDITNLKVEFTEGHTTTIELFDGVGVKMKYPSISTIDKMRHAGNFGIEEVFSLISECMDYVFTAEEMFDVKDQSQQEIREFLENLTSEQFAKIQNFFDSMPRLRQKFEYDCPVCGKHHEKYLEGMTSFFS